MSTGTEGVQAAPAQPLHDAHVACWVRWMPGGRNGLNEQAIAAHEREHGPMTEQQRRMVR